MRYEPTFENELPDLSERDAEIADIVLASASRDHFVKVVNQFAWLVNSCASDIEAAMLAGLCAVALPDSCHLSDVRDYIRPQFRVDLFRLDFLLCPEGAEDPTYCIGIECDGAAYHSTPKQRGYDAWRERKILAEQGIPVIRFSGRDIFRDAQGCVRVALDKASEYRRAGIGARPELFKRSEGPRYIHELATETLNRLRGRIKWPA